MPEYLWRNGPLADDDDGEGQDSLTADLSLADHPIPFKEDVPALTVLQIARIRATIDVVKGGSDALAQLAQLFREDYGDHFIAARPQKPAIEMLAVVADHSLSRIGKSIQEVIDLHFYAVGVQDVKLVAKALKECEEKAVDHLRHVLVSRGERGRSLADEILKSVYTAVRSSAALAAASAFLDLEPDQKHRSLFGSTSASNRMARPLATELLAHMRATAGHPSEWEWPDSLTLAPLLQSDEDWQRRDWAALQAFAVITRLICPQAVTELLKENPHPSYSEADRLLYRAWQGF